MTTTGSMPSCWIASYMAMQLCTVMTEMNTSAVPAPAAVIAAWMSADVAPGSVTSTAVTGMPASVEHRLEQRAVRRLAAPGCWRR